MNTTRTHIRRPAAMLLCLAGLAAPVLAQSAPQDAQRQPSQLRGMIQPVPVDAAIIAKAMQRRPTGTMKIHGLAGALDYERGQEPSIGPLEPLATLTPGARVLPQDQLDPSEEAAYLVDLNWAFLDALEAEGPHRAAITLPSGDRFELVFVKKQESMGPRRFTWIGQIAGIPASDFVLARYDQRIDLSVREYETGQRFDLRYSVPAGAHRLVLPNRDGPRGICGVCGGCGDVGHEGHAHPPMAADEASPAAPNGPGTPPGVTDGPGVADPTTQVDVLFLATNQALANLGTEGIIAWAMGAMSDYNDLILPNSGVAGRARIAAVLGIPAGYDEAPTLDQDLSAMATASGAFSFLPFARDSVRADHVVLLRQTNQPGPRPGTVITGLAYVRRNAQPATVAGSIYNSAFGFSVVCLSSPDDSKRVFAHELTHNFGGLHDPANNELMSEFPAPHGFNFTCPNPLLLFCNQGWNTVMAYGPNPALSCGPTNWLGWFSSPNISITLPFPFLACNPASLGVAGVNNVAALVVNNRVIVSQWRVAVTRQWVAANATAQGAEGTQFRPWPGVVPAITAVQGPLGTAEILVAPGTYAEASPGNPTVLSKPATITNSSVGLVILR